MITSGLLITLSSDAQLAASAEQTLKERRELTLGDRNARWLPVAAESETARAGLDLHDWIQTVPGVEFVDVIQVNFLEAAETMKSGEVLS